MTVFSVFVNGQGTAGTVGTKTDNDFNCRASGSKNCQGYTLN